MKKLAIVIFVVAALSHCGRLSAQGVDMIYVEGEVRNVVESIPLPFCEVQYRADHTTVASARCDEAGLYQIPSMPAGEYTLLITQFGDTLMRVKGVRLEGDSRIICRVALPDASRGQMCLPTNLKQINLGEVRITAPTHMLAKMGLLITSPSDPRLWNFNGRMGGDRSAAVADPSSCNKFLRSSWGLAVSLKNSTMKNELLLFGRILDEYAAPPADTTSRKD